MRGRGHQAPIYYHGAMERLCTLYETLGVPLGELRPVAGAKKDELVGRVIVCPPSALNDRWSRRLPDPVTSMASGWMRVRQRARQKNVELPLVISDHGDWDELTRTIREVAPKEVWITHGREDAQASIGVVEDERNRPGLRRVGEDGEHGAVGGAERVRFSRAVDERAERGQCER